MGPDSIDSGYFRHKPQQMNSKSIESDPVILPAAGPVRRLAAMFYDLLLLLAVLLVAIALALMFSRGAFTYHNPFFRTLIFLLSFGFYTWFWLHGGQTLGMRTWRLRVQQRNGAPLTVWQAVLRYMTAIPSLALGGIGFFCMRVYRDKLTLYDRLSGTILVFLPKNG